MPSCRFHPGAACLGALLLSASPALAASVPIGSLHCNDESGAPQTKGQTVTVAGVVTGQFSTQRNVRLVVQDATGGVTVYGSPPDCAAVGDSVSVTGVVTGFGGLTEITGNAGTPLAIEHLGRAARVPAALVLTPAQVDAAEQAGCEPNESRLVEVDGVRILSARGEALADTATFREGANYRLVAPAGADTVTMRVAGAGGCDALLKLQGQRIPAVPVRVIGILSQFAGRSNPHGGYQIQPRTQLDIRPILAPAPKAGEKKP